MDREQVTMWATSVGGKLCNKVKVTAERNKDKIPYSTVNGVFDDWSDRINWWTNGFFGGQLWQLYHAFGLDIFRDVAKNIEEKLDASLGDYMGVDHDCGFKWLLTSVANYKETGDEQSKNRGLLAAANMAGRFNLKGQFIRAWNDFGEGNLAGYAIIDCMMNLPLLYWAAKEINDPRFLQIAQAHADMVMETFIREDGSSNHIIVFNPETGEVVGPLRGQGMAVGSSWTRGQGWALYGFTLSYIHTGKQEYLETARKVARYFIKNIPDSFLIPVDFWQEKDCEWEDSTAATIAACGLIELAKHTKGEEGQLFFDTAVRLLMTLDEKRCNWDMDTDHIVEKGSLEYHTEEHNTPIIYGDYYFTEAILKLCDKELFMW